MSRFGTLEDAFDLPRLEDSIQEMNADQALEKADELEQEFKNKDHFELHDEEMDEISATAIEYGKSLHDLGLSVEVKHAGEIFTASSHMFKIALDARNSKMEKKLKMLKLELDRLKLDRTNPDPGELVQQEAVTVLDRNELLQQIKLMTSSNTK